MLCSGGEQLGTHKKGCTRPQTAYFFCGTGAQEGMWQLAAFLQEKAHNYIDLGTPPQFWALLEALQPSPASSSSPKHFVFTCQDAASGPVNANESKGITRLLPANCR